MIKLEGWADLDRALGQLPKATARNALRRVLRKAAVPIKAEMEERAPVADEPYYRGKGARRRLVRPGFTKESIEISSTLNPAQRREAKKETNSFAEVHVGSRRGSAAHLQEFGTANHPPQPYMTPAWEARKHEALKTIGDELGNEIEKAAKRYAKKLAKSGG